MPLYLDKHPMFIWKPQREHHVRDVWRRQCDCFQKRSKFNQLPFVNSPPWSFSSLKTFEEEGICAEHIRDKWMLKNVFLAFLFNSSLLLFYFIENNHPLNYLWVQLSSFENINRKKCFHASFSYVGGEIRPFVVSLSNNLEARCLLRVADELYSLNTPAQATYGSFERQIATKVTMISPQE